MRVYIITRKDRIGQFITDIIADLNRWNGEKPMTVTMQGKKEKRSLDQNALYFKWCQIIADETGNDKDDIHDCLKQMFLGVKTIDLGVYMDTIPSSTKILTVQSMAEYMEKIQAWAATDLGINLPSGDDARLASLETR